MSENSTTQVPFLPSDRDSSGRSLGNEELGLLRKVIESGNLFSVPGNMVPRFEREAADLLGLPHARAVSSGSAAFHTALAAFDIGPGDEVLTTPITDMGAISPILFHGAVPIFADVDPETLNVTAETLRPHVTDRTKLIVATHLFGNPCDMDPILSLAAETGIPVLEDAAQAYMATYNGRLVGTMGDMGMFSLQQGKHITCGEGGLVVTGSDSLARRARIWADKGWNYAPQDADHEFLGLNYRMSELQGAVALAQIRKLPAMTEQRVRMAGLLRELLDDVPGVRPIEAIPGSTQTYWRFCLFIDEEEVGIGPDRVAESLLRVKVWSRSGYIRQPAFMCAQFRERRTFAESGFPYGSFGHSADFEDPEAYPGCWKGLGRILVLPWTERYEEEHVRYIAAQIRQVVLEARGAVA